MADCGLSPMCEDTSKTRESEAHVIERSALQSANSRSQREETPMAEEIINDKESGI